MKKISETIYTKLMDMPYGVHGYTKRNLDGSWSIILNVHDDNERRRQAYDHEVSHIQNGDYDSVGICASALELERHAG
jgi:hypothetical protein